MGKKCAVGSAPESEGASVSSSTLAAQPVSDSWWASLTPAQQAELEEARAAVRREHSSKKKRKKRSRRRTRRSLS